MTLDRQLAIFFGTLSALAAAVALFGLYGWGQWMRHGTWPDASSPTIDLVVAPQGVWEHRWGWSSSAEVWRNLTLRNPDGTYLKCPDTLRFDVRITPSSALEPAAASRAAADGWIECKPLSGAVTSVSFDPTEVARIEWRATPGSTPSAGATPPFVLFVPGLADSEEPHGWLIDAAMAVGGAAAALALGSVALRHSSARSP